ncbi:signal peptidase I [Brevundimonas sp. FT23028]|uniref:signal peptidase I n=1 Tax=Brevundimonas sp. FT23028 TaxID=3393748 RepID=UPI003B588A6D
MSDEHKPHDDHAADTAHDAGHDADHHEAAAPEAAADSHAPEADAPAAEAGHEDAGHDASVEVVAAVEDHHTPSSESHDTHEHVAAVDSHDDAEAHAAPVAAEAVADEAPHTSAEIADTPEPAEAHPEDAAVETHAAPAAVEAVTDEAAQAPAHAETSHETPAEAHGSDVAAAAAVAGVTAAAASTEQKRPIWSDAGDAPFEDVDSTPVYARGKKAKKEKDAPKGLLGELWEIGKTIAVALLIAMVLRILLFQPFTIPSASMEPNLYQGDYIVVSKWSYGYSKHSIIGSPSLFDGRISLPGVSRAPARGDIVVFKLPSDNKTDYIKRLIGLPGDRVQMIDNVLHINGQPVRDVTLTDQDVTNMYGLPVIQLEETFPDGSKTFRVQDFGADNELDNTPVFEIPAGYYFMMGDNRDNSSDSRVSPAQGGVGLVPAENLIGKAEIILFSWNEGASFGNPVSWFTKVRLSRWFKVLH